MVSIGFYGLACMIFLLVMGVPVTFALGAVAAVGLTLVAGLDSMLQQTIMVAMQTGTDFILLCIPLFVFMGKMVFHTGIARDLFTCIERWLGRLQGGLLISSVVTCACFGAITGSSSASVATMAGILRPELKRYKYDDKLSTGAITSAGTLAILIPPSAGFIFYGVLTDTSVGRLFLAGIIPGLISTALYCIYCWLSCKINPSLGPIGQSYSWKERIVSLKGTWGLLVLFGIVIGGIYGGVFTPTEAAAVSVVYGLVVGVFIYREVKMKDMIDILVDSGKTTGGIMLIIGAATLFSYVCTVFGIAQAAQALLLEISGNKYIFLLIVNVIFLIAGCFVDANSAMYIFIPIMYPVATQLGIDPVHFGVIATVNLAIGQVTPPVGVNLFVAIGVSEKLQGLRDKTKVTIVSMSKAVWPQIVACIIALLLITYVPWFSTVLLFGK